MLKLLLPCKHEFSKQDEVELGATLGWDMRPTIAFSKTSICSKCGSLKQDEYIIPGLQRIWPDRFAEDDWPIDKDGNRMEIRR